MSFVEWSADLDVGNEEMNRQHVRLIGIINEFHDALEQHRPNAQLVAIFERVAEYARVHFRDEEALMAAHRFAGLSRHRHIHQQLVARVGELLAKLRGKADEEAPREIQYFLKNWLTAHIKGIDAQYRDAVKIPSRAAAPKTAPLRPAGGGSPPLSGA